MDRYLYQCHYCGKEYKPNRRHKQLFCSNSCRTNSHIRSKKLKLQTPTITTPEVHKPNQIEQMSVHGILNAAAGTAAVNILTNLLTKDDNKPVTKKDFREFINNIYSKPQPVNNLQNRFDGARPFYLMKTQSIVYLINPTNIGTKQ